MRFFIPISLFLFSFVFVSCSSKKELATYKNKEKDKKSSASKAVSKNETASLYSPEILIKETGTRNEKLKKFISSWYAAPYAFGGSDKTGIDCSHFAAKLYMDVYGIRISGPVNAIEPQTQNIKVSEAREGDFVFFKINSDKVSHIGVYIGNNKFIHASTKRGVIINDLNEAYYKKFLYKTGRLK